MVGPSDFFVAPSATRMVPISRKEISMLMIVSLIYLPLSRAPPVYIDFLYLRETNVAISRLPSLSSFYAKWL